jgi:hypothetical protein
MAEHWCHQLHGLLDNSPMIPNLCMASGSQKSLENPLHMEIYYMIQPNLLIS